MNLARRLPLGLSLLMLGGLLTAEETPSFRVILNAANPTTSAARVEVADIFFKKTTRWPDGSSIVAVDQSVSSPVRQSFTREVLRQSLSGVEDYWKRQVFSGRETPLPVKSSDREVIAFVASNPGAIGYVSGKDRLPEGIIVLAITK